jgi:hypothetical protein
VGAPVSGSETPARRAARIAKQGAPKTVKDRIGTRAKAQKRARKNRRKRQGTWR